MNKRILIVDSDVEALCGLSNFLLEAGGFDVAVADGPAKAYRELMHAAQLPDVVAISLLNQEMGGLLFLKALNSHHKYHKLPVQLMGYDNIPGNNLNFRTVRAAIAFVLADQDMVQHADGKCCGIC